jgi:hypothetical protein
VIALAAPRAARADAAGDLVKLGIEQYKAGKYAEAKVTLGKAHDLDGKPETLFALAQAERLAGDCVSAVAHYKKVIERVSSLEVAKLVQQNLQLCEKDLPPPPPVKADPAPQSPEPVEPTIVTKTVVREVPRTDRLAAGFCIGGGVVLGMSGGLLLAAASNRDAADRAGSLQDHDALADRANLEQKVGLIGAGVGAAMIGVAVVRWMTAKETTTDVAITPTAGGSMIVLSSVW